jgi:hypothetical protein
MERLFTFHAAPQPARYCAAAPLTSRSPNSFPEADTIFARSGCDADWLVVDIETGTEIGNDVDAAHRRIHLQGVRGLGALPAGGRERDRPLAPPADGEPNEQPYWRSAAARSPGLGQERNTVRGCVERSRCDQNTPGSALRGRGIHKGPQTPSSVSRRSSARSARSRLWRSRHLSE